MSVLENRAHEGLEHGLGFGDSAYEFELVVDRRPSRRGAEDAGVVPEADGPADGAFDLLDRIERTVGGVLHSNRLRAGCLTVVAADSLRRPHE